MTDILDRDQCFHCDRPIRWQGSDRVCRECHSKWGEPTIEQEKYVEGTDDSDDDGFPGVVTHTSGTADFSVKPQTIWIAFPECPDCGELLSPNPGILTQGLDWYCDDCEQFVDDEEAVNPDDD